MPLNSEIIPNRPLAAHELRQIIEKDVHEILMRDGMLTGQIAYGRCSYKISYELLLDNFTIKKHIGNVVSQARPADVLRQEEELAAIKAHPLAAPSPDAVVTSGERTREIDSPNRTRIEEGLPLTTTVRQGEGLVERQIQYTPDELPERETQVHDRDTSQESAERLGLLPLAGVDPAADPGPVPGDA